MRPHAAFTETNFPFGSLKVTPALPPRPLSVGEGAAASERWMISETDQNQSDVVNAPWKTSTPAKPVHGNVRLRVRFDGGADIEIVTP